MTWQDVLSEIGDHVYRLKEQGCPDPFFRGQRDASWGLLPGLARDVSDKDHETENRLNYDFHSYGASQMPFGISGWEVLFRMQHHRMLTRLLDWTYNLPIAVYFAVQQAECEAALFVMDPYEFNNGMVDQEDDSRKRRKVIVSLQSSYPEGYEDCFIRGGSHSLGKIKRPMAVVPTYSHPRVLAQQGVFTLHTRIDGEWQGLEELDSPRWEGCRPISKVVIPEESLLEASAWLETVGITDFSVFPDLDHLASWLIQKDSARVRRVKARRR